MENISKYFPTTPSDENIHSVVVPLEQTITSGREWENKVFIVKALYRKQCKSFSWPVDLSAVTLNNMKWSILNIFSFPQYMKPEDIILRFGKTNKNFEEFDLDKNDIFRQYLKTSSLSLKVRIDTIKKPFSDWNFKKVCNLLRLPFTFQDFPKFVCSVDALNTPIGKELLVHLCTDLKHRQKTILTNINEASCSEYVSPFLMVAATLFGGRVKLCPEFYIEGKYGNGRLDFCFRLFETIVGIVEVKNQLVNKGIAQILLQTHTALETNRKYKYSESKGQFMDKVYGIVTDATIWWFVECTMDGDEPQFRIHSSTPVVIDWSEESESLKAGVARILGRIIWLLKEAETWDKLDMEKRRGIMGKDQI